MHFDNRAFAALGGALYYTEDFWWHGLQRYGRKAMYAWFCKVLGVSQGEKNDLKEVRYPAIALKDLQITPTGQV